jgi:DNA-binding NtrC family response regulator
VVDVSLLPGHYSTKSAVEAIQKSACDYLEKPLDLQKLRERVTLANQKNWRLKPLAPVTFTVKSSRLAIL